jgi:hypothetical protein
MQTHSRALAGCLIRAGALAVVVFVAGACAASIASARSYADCTFRFRSAALVIGIADARPAECAAFRRGLGAGWKDGAGSLHRPTHYCAWRWGGTFLVVMGEPRSGVAAGFCAYFGQKIPRYWRRVQ